MSYCVLHQPQPRNVSELLSYINNNDIESFKQGIKFIDPEVLSRLIIETIIIKERKEFFDILLDKLEVTINSDPSSCSNTNYYKQCFVAISNGSNPYYAIRLTQVYKHVTPAEKGSLLRLAVHFGNKPISHELILSGADLNGFDLMGRTPLEEAIKCNNFELVCMLLYYGVDVNLLHLNLTAFVYSISCRSSEEIQTVLLEYESDFNLSYNGVWSTLFFAIKHNSPVTLEIIKRGANINYYNEAVNAMSLAIQSRCDSEVFRLLWNEFDYEILETDSFRSLLLIFLDEDVANPMFVEYLRVLMENETKLQLVINHHNNSGCFPIISRLYLQCLQKNVDRETAESFILHLLSHGVHVFAEDIDIIYNMLKDSTPFLDMLLYMDLDDVHICFKTFMYFKYTPMPDLKNYMTYVIFPHRLTH